MTDRVDDALDDSELDRVPRLLVETEPRPEGREQRAHEAKILEATLETNPKPAMNEPLGRAFRLHHPPPSIRPAPRTLMSSRGGTPPP